MPQKPRHILTASSMLALLLGGCTSSLVTTDVPGVQPTPAFEATASPADLGFSTEGITALHETMQGFVDRGEVAGMVTLLARHGEIVDLHAYGYSDLETAEKMKTDALFRLYSMTKPVTGVAMMQLHEQGLWNLNDPITDYLPEMRDLKVMTGVDENGNAITVDAERAPTMRELMSHTAGFGYGLWGNSPVDRAFKDGKILLSDGPQALVDNVANIPLIFQPGAWWSYSVAVDLQARIAERLTGQTYSNYLQENIFDPLGMDETFYVTPPEKQDRMATLYVHAGEDKALTELTSGLYVDLYTPPLAFEGGGHGLISTASDYARFASMVANHGELDGVRILQPETVDLMLTNVLPDNVRIFSDPTGKHPGIPDVGFALDWAVAKKRAEGGYGPPRGSAFWGGAAGTWFWSDPSNDIAFVGMIQCIGGQNNGCPGEQKLRGGAAQKVYEALSDPEKFLE